MKELYILEEVLVYDVRIAAGISLLLTFLVGLVGNVIIIWVILAFLQSKKNIPNVLILIQATVDLLTVLVTYIQPLTTYFHGSYIGGRLACNIHAWFVLFFNSIAIFVVIAMVYDRYFAVSRPYCYQERMTYSKNKTILFIVVCLTLSTAICLPTIVGSSHNTLYYPGTYCMFTLRIGNESDEIALILYTIILSLILLSVIVGNIGGCINVYRMISFRMRHTGSRQIEINNTEEYLFLRLSIVTLLVFLLVWVPLHICLCISLSKTTYPEWYGMVSVRLAALHSVVNPWLHPVLRRRFRKAFFWVFSWCMHHATCGIMNSPQQELDEILNDAHASIGRGEQNEDIELRNMDESTGNVKFDIAQRNIIDYVDFPENVTPSEQTTFRDKTSRESYDIEMQNVSKDVISSGSESYNK